MTSSATDVCHILEWDTKFFGFCIAKINGDILNDELLRNINIFCHRNHVRCLYFLAGINDAITIGLAEKNDFHLVDVRMTFEYRKINTVADKADVQSLSHLRVRPSHSEDLDYLMKIAQSSYQDTRFYFDANFSRNQVDLLYKTWIQRSCDDLADIVIVAELNTEPVGYITCHLDQDHKSGRIGLVGVGEGQKGKGIGKALVSVALNWFIDNNVERVTVVTQGRNIPAQRLYQSCGFLTQSVNLWYHRWYSQ